MNPEEGIPSRAPEDVTQSQKYAKFTFIAGAPQDRYVIRRNAMQSVWRERKARRVRIPSRIVGAKPRQLLVNTTPPLNTGPSQPDLEKDDGSERVPAEPDLNTTKAKFTTDDFRPEALTAYVQKDADEEHIAARKHASLIRIRNRHTLQRQFVRSDLMPRSPSPISSSRKLAGEVDPFGVLPIILQPEDRAILHHCKFVVLC
jgi:hypothetical protein